MTDIIDSLHEDHANLAKLLDALERQLGLFDQGETPDYDIVRGVVDYCLGYPDLYHHPRAVQRSLHEVSPKCHRGRGKHRDGKIWDSNRGCCLNLWRATEEEDGCHGKSLCALA